MRPLLPLAVLACLVAAGACSGPPPPEQAAGGDPSSEPGASSSARSPVEEEPAPTPAELWAACLEDPSRLLECERHVRLTRDDPALADRLDDLSGAYPESWAQALLDWRGLLTLETLTQLRAFGRIEA